MSILAGIRVASGEWISALLWRPQVLVTINDALPIELAYVATVAASDVLAAHALRRVPSLNIAFLRLVGGAPEIAVVQSTVPTAGEVGTGHGGRRRLHTDRAVERCARGRFAAGCPPRLSPTRGPGSEQRRSAGRTVRIGPGRCTPDRAMCCDCPGIRQCRPRAGAPWLDRGFAAASDSRAANAGSRPAEHGKAGGEDFSLAGLLSVRA